MRVVYNNRSGCFKLCDDKKKKTDTLLGDDLLGDDKFTPITQNNIQSAVSSWMTDKTKARNIYGDISNWDTSSVTDMNSLFNPGSTLNPPFFNDNIGSWNTSKVIYMESTFQNTLFNQDISNWNTNNVKRMTEMFLNARSFNQDISNWNTTNVIDCDYMFINTRMTQSYMPQGLYTSCYKLAL